jgi:RNA processing factor Prp31
MKTTQFLIVSVLAALAVGCNKSSPTIGGASDSGTKLIPVEQKCENARKIAANTWQQGNVSATNALANAKESAETVVDYSFDQRSACVVQAVAELDSLDQEIRQLSDKLATASDSVKIDARHEIIMLSDQRAALNQRLADLQNATTDNWDEAKTEFKMADDYARTSWRQTWQWLIAKLGS